MQFIFIVLSILMSANVFAMAPMPSPGNVQVDHDFELYNKPAPEFTLPLLKGSESSLTQLRQGKKSILFFWATWCPHCHEELGRLKNGLADKIASKNIKLILIDSGDTKEEVQKYMTKKQMSFDVVLDTEDVLGEPYQIVGVPTFFFGDEKGVIKSFDHELPDNIEAMFQ